MPSISTDELFQDLLKTELVSLEDLEAVWAGMPPQSDGSTIGLPNAPNARGKPNDRNTLLNQLADRLLDRGLITVFQRDKLRAEPKFRFVVNNYLLLDQLQANVQAVVYLARHRWLGHKVALKLFNRQRHPGSFGRSVHQLPKLRHPNLVPTYDIGVFDEQRYIVTEFVPGVNLEDLVVRHKRLSWSDALLYLRQIAQALEYGHKRGVFHQDLRPSHMLVDDLKHARLLGLGVGPALNLQQAGIRGQDHPAQLLDAVRYAAPEQFRTSEPIDHRADVYSLGCVLYYLLVGTPPYSSSAYSRVMIDHQKLAVPSLATAQVGAPPELDDFFQRMLAKLPENRPQSMTDVIAAFEKFLTKGGIVWQDPRDKDAPAAASSRAARGALVGANFWRLFLMGAALGCGLGLWFGWRLSHSYRVEPALQRLDDEASSRRTLENALVEAAVQLHRKAEAPPPKSASR